MIRPGEHLSTPIRGVLDCTLEIPSLPGRALAGQAFLGRRFFCILSLTEFILLGTPTGLVSGPPLSLLRRVETNHQMTSCVGYPVDPDLLSYFSSPLVELEASRTSQGLLGIMLSNSTGKTVRTTHRMSSGDSREYQPSSAVNSWLSSCVL
jgi:hypothetical protein